MQQLLNNETWTQLKITSDFLFFFQNIIWIIIFIIAAMGFFFWYINKKYRSKYLLEESSKPEFLAELVTKGIEEGIEGSKILYYFIIYPVLFSIILIIFGPIAYYFLKLNGIFAIVFLDVVFLLQLNSLFLKFLIDRGKKNNGYISPSIIGNLEKIIISISDYLISNKIIYLIYIIITFSLLIIQIRLFYIWAFLWILYYSYEFVIHFYQYKLMLTPPRIVNVEYSTGEIDNNLILYQTTSIDYRFKRKDDVEELIIPSTSIKSIQLNYDFQLNLLDELINLEPLKIDKFKFPSFIKNHLDKFIQLKIGSKITNSKSGLLYKKAVIYSKIGDFENTEKSIKMAIELNKNIKDIATNDKKLINIQNEKWFKDLMNE